MVEIRKIKRRDEPAVKQLIHDIMESEFPGDSAAYAYDDLDKLAAHYGGKREVFFVADDGGRLIGTVGIKEDSPDTALLRRIFVDKQSRGKGLGRRLLQAAVEFCKEHDYKTVMFHGTNRMKTAVELCRKNGFVTDGISQLGPFDLVVLFRKL